ncbi:MAG: hypothetical protein ACR2QM_00535 [Longimicrobiales bacterium]
MAPAPKQPKARRTSGPLPSTSFPLRLGAIDAGSNAIRFAVAEFTDPTTYRIISKMRMPIRLGHLVFTAGELDDDTMEAAAKAFRLFRLGLEQLGAVSHRAVATSATREASNREEFVSRIFDSSGIQLTPISGDKEAQYVHIAVGSRLNLSKGRWILVDLGGGSVEVSLVDDTGILWSQTYPMGTVRMLETLQASAGSNETIRDWVGDRLRHLTIPPPEAYPGPTSVAATGGNIEAIARLALSYVNPREVSRVDLDRLESVVQLLTDMTVEERAQKLGLRPDRADVILPAALVYQYFAQQAGAQEIVVPAVGVREGVLLELAAEF